MADVRPDEELRVSVPILGPIIAKGPAVFIVIAILAVGWVMWEVQKNHEAIDARYRGEQKAEHEELQNWLDYTGCLNRLTLYVARTPKDQALDFFNMPPELVKCSPKFLYDKEKK